jgi:putative transposase
MNSSPPPGRRAPAKGVKILPHQPTIIFLTICARRPANWIASPTVHASLTEIWRNANAWLVGYYLLMPDHIHLFCAPRDLHFTIEKWIAFWKSEFTRRHMNPEWTWQRNAVHYRLRTQDDYREKWEYIRQNPVRANLTSTPEQWPYTGTLNPLTW